jgi:hypothetical protein
MPVIAVAERGEGRVLAVTSDSTWRWGFEHIGRGGTQREYQHFWNSAIRWLIQDPELKLVRLELHDDVLPAESSLEATVRVLTPDYSPAPNQEGTLVVFFTPLSAVSQGTEAGRSILRSLSIETDHAGLWYLEEVLDEPGVYEFEVEVPSVTGPLRDENLLLVIPDLAQLRDIVPRDHLLEEIARASGGSYSLLPGLRARDLEFEEPRFVEVHQRELIQLWDHFLLFLLILGLLATEWSLRRRWGRL